MNASISLTNQLQRVEADVTARLWGRVRDLHVELHQRGLVLTGRTESDDAKRLAQHFAGKVACLPVMANEIKVGGPRGGESG